MPSSTTRSFSGMDTGNVACPFRAIHPRSAYGPSSRVKLIRTITMVRPVVSNKCVPSRPPACVSGQKRRSSPAAVPMTRHGIYSQSDRSFH